MKTDKEYKNRIMVAGQNLSLFSNSVENCDIPMMLENSARFLETIKNADHLYLNMSTAVQKNLKDTFNNSQILVQRYFDIKSGIKSSCRCSTV